ncbi:decaprenylphospho-beta-D-erythro-pentofuranosid-2-ulose 2-reductase [Thermocatellispora tengchongensis]|uniref:Decaprenylphospho-beta-D-erythro-pentofuranosid-2-ulose 2-reductase n=1 Tax=Thermocatellispora tengchongensis TaxID=1073253 RepID=A0A840PBT1_9ACTN|nr:SDR family NAD(P)-dependent oxidoreductase [Thermocatellispora tengchongensis]MBB5134890.1 decaprenylphospho-beta-D-erythro-pentofuranosid-2-ulose 2-reductase [Thermocatellispora tengchongensis]
MKNALGSVDTVLVLGGRSEIGLAVAERLVRDGARKVVLAARAPLGEPPALRGAEVHLIDFDATRPDGHGEVIEEAVKLAGDLDVIVAAFGVLGDQAAYDRDPASAAASIAVNLGGHVSTGLYAARRLREQGHGTLVVLSSVAGVRVRRGNMVYGAAKAGLDGFARALGDSLHGTGAQVMVVRPGFVHGRMTAGMPAAPFATTPAAVADAVATALRDGTHIVWVPGILRYAFTLLRHLPRPLWRRIPR